MATVVQLQQPAVVVAAQPLPPTNLRCIKGMAITQLVIGALTLVIGIATAAISPANWVGAAGCGIGGGAWITLTGIIGVLSAMKWENRCLSGAYLALSILCAIGSFGWGIIHILAAAWYSITTFCDYRMSGWVLEATNCGKKQGVAAMHIVLMILAITEFFVSIIASCFSCCCGGNRNATVVVHPQPQVAMTTTQYAQPQYNQQPMAVQPQYAQPVQPHPHTQPHPQPTM